MKDESEKQELLYEIRQYVHNNKIRKSQIGVILGIHSLAAFALYYGADCGLNFTVDMLKRALELLKKSMQCKIGNDIV